jgi:hypothetical protein
MVVLIIFFFSVCCGHVYASGSWCSESAVGMSWIQMKPAYVGFCISGVSVNQLKYCIDKLNKSMLSGLVKVFMFVLPLVCWWWCCCCLFLRQCTMKSSAMVIVVAAVAAVAVASMVAEAVTAAMVVAVVVAMVA